MSGAGYLKGRVLPGCASEASSQMKCRGGRQMALSGAMFAGFVAVSLTVPGAMAAATPSTGPTRILTGPRRFASVDAHGLYPQHQCCHDARAWALRHVLVGLGPGQAIGNAFPRALLRLSEGRRRRAPSGRSTWTSPATTASRPLGTAAPGSAGSLCSPSRRPGGSRPRRRGAPPTGAPSAGATPPPGCYRRGGHAQPAPEEHQVPIGGRVRRPRPRRGALQIAEPASLLQ